MERVSLSPRTTHWNWTVLPAKADRSTRELIHPLESPPKPVNGLSGLLRNSFCFGPFTQAEDGMAVATPLTSRRASPPS